MNMICKCGHYKNVHVIIGCMDCLEIATCSVQKCDVFIPDNLKSLEKAYEQFSK